MDETPSAIDNYGFPMGYFVIKSVATNRVLDVEGGKIDDGVELVLWPEKESSLVEGKHVPESSRHHNPPPCGTFCTKSVIHNYFQI